jgi:hypothetical protein
MNPQFAAVVDRLHPSFETLLAMLACKPLALRGPVPTAGIYLLSEGNAHLYVGRSTRLKERLRNHCRTGASHKMAALRSDSPVGRLGG